MAPVAPVPAAPSSAPLAAAAPAARPAQAAAQPAAALPSALTRYTQATRYGDLLFLSGQIAVDSRTGEFAMDASIEDQTRKVLENVRSILELHGLTMSNALSVTVYLANIGSLPAVDGVYATFFKSTPPARSVVEVQRLPRGAQIEITVVAGR
jgi:2-iminobutanoate/2-iminopropanoate deaminase